MVHASANDVSRSGGKLAVPPPTPPSQLLRYLLSTLLEIRPAANKCIF